MPPYDPAEYRRRMELLELLELADAMHDDECSTRYEFHAEGVTAWLDCDWPAREFGLTLILVGREQPVFNMCLRWCETILAVATAKEKYLECVGSLRGEAGGHPLCGFRLYLHPFLRVEPFHVPGS